MEEIQISMRELDQIITQTIRRTLEEAGLVSRYIFRSEVIEKIGRASCDKGILSGYLSPINNGNNNSKVRFLRSEFEQWERLVCV